MKVSKLALSVLAAADQYTKLRDRLVHPAGEFDKQGRFRLSTHCECCEGIRSPSKAYPYSEMVHARSVRHVAHQTGLTDYIKAIRMVVVVIDKSGVEAANELLATKQFAVQLACITRDVKAAKAAAKAAAIEAKVAKAIEDATVPVPCSNDGMFCDRGLCGGECDTPF